MQASLVERDREIDARYELVARTRAGDGGAALIEGAPGVGETRLLGGQRVAALAAEGLTNRDLARSLAPA